MPGCVSVLGPPEPATTQWAVLAWFRRLEARRLRSPRHLPPGAPGALGFRPHASSLCPTVPRPVLITLPPFPSLTRTRVPGLWCHLISRPSTWSHLQRSFQVKSQSPTLGGHTFGGPPFTPLPCAFSPSHLLPPVHRQNSMAPSSLRGRAHLSVCASILRARRRWTPVGLASAPCDPRQGARDEQVSLLGPQPRANANPARTHLQTCRLPSLSVCHSAAPTDSLGARRSDSLKDFHIGVWQTSRPLLGKLTAGLGTQMGPGTQR